MIQFRKGSTAADKGEWANLRYIDSYLITATRRLMLQSLHESSFYLPLCNKSPPG